MRIPKQVTKLFSSKKRKIISGLSLTTVFVLLVVIFIIKNNNSPAVVIVTSSSPTPQTSPSSTPTPVPKVASITSGELLDPSVNLKHTVAAIVENSTDARPQAGLAQADIVFEAIAEGGVTRFLSIYHDKSPDKIGPIRSARPYFVEWAHGLDTPLAHAGGSPDALDLIYLLGSKDIDEFGYSSTFYRSTDRYAPHNLYTNYTKLIENINTRKMPIASFKPFAKREKTPKSPISATKIDVAISGPNYNSNYIYDSTNNKYSRSQAGDLHKTDDGAIISPDVIIAIETNTYLSDDGIHSVYETNGSGPALVFQNGGVENITWSKDNSDANISFKNLTTSELAKIQPGKIWIVALPSLSRVSYE